MSTPSARADEFNAKPWLKSYPKDVDYDSPIPARPMGDVFDESIKKYGDKTFLNFMEPKLGYMGKKYTYKEIGEMVDRAAAGMQKQGLGKGSKVGLLLPNSPYYVINYYAALKIGATVVNLNPLTPVDDLAELCKDAEVDMMVTLDVKDTYNSVDAIRE